MTDHDIIHKVQDFFDNPDMRVNSTDLLNGDNVNTAVADRMINAYQRFMSNQTFEKQIEFECSLRNFLLYLCLLYTSPSPRDRTRSRMPSSA